MSVWWRSISDCTASPVRAGGVRVPPRRCALATKFNSSELVSERVTFPAHEMRALEIFDVDEQGKLSATLHEVLSLTNPPGSQLWWTLRYIEARGDIGAVWPAGLKDLESAASSRRFGLELSWEQLLGIAVLLREVVDIRLDGWQRLPRPGDGPEPLHLRVEVLDSTLFRVAARDRAVFARLEQRFHDTRAVELSEMFSS
jgi:hypothetical protein